MHNTIFTVLLKYLKCFDKIYSENILTEYERTKSWEFFITADMLHVAQEHDQIQ